MNPELFCWDDWILKHNRKPNLKTALIWAMDEIFWRARYLIGDPKRGYYEVHDYWEEDIITAWKRSYSREYS